MDRGAAMKVLVNGKPYAGEIDVAMRKSDTPDFPRINPDLHGSITIKLKKDEARKLRRFLKRHCPITRLKRLRRNLSLAFGHHITRRKAKMVLRKLK
jgi:hypothetical protein